MVGEVGEWVIPKWQLWQLDLGLGNKCLVCRGGVGGKWLPHKVAWLINVYPGSVLEKPTFSPFEIFLLQRQKKNWWLEVEERIIQTENKNKCSTVRVISHWDKFPREVMDFFSSQYLQNLSGHLYGRCFSQTEVVGLHIGIIHCNIMACVKQMT